MSREIAFRRTPPKLPRSPEGEAIASAMRRLTASPDWQVMIDHLKAAAFEKWLAIPASDGGALLENAIRKTVIAELEQLAKRVTDDGPSDQRE